MAPTARNLHPGVAERRRGRWRGAGEALRDAAGRELLEEIGYRAEGLSPLASVHTSTGRSTEVGHLFRCRAVRDGGGARPEPTEFVEVVEMPFGEALDRALNGTISDSATVLGLLWAARGREFGPTCTCARDDDEVD